MSKGTTPLSFAIDTSQLEAGAKAAEAFVEKAKALGGATNDANKGLGDLGKGAGDSAKGMADATKAAEELAAANKKAADSAKEAQAAQTALANAPKPAPPAQPPVPAPGSNNGHLNTHYVTGADGQHYADQQMADLAAQIQQRREEERARQDAMVLAGKKRWEEQNAPKGSKGGAAGIADAAEAAGDMADAAEAAGTASRGMASGMGIAGVAGVALAGVVGASLVTALVQGTKATIEMGDESVLLERRFTSLTGSAEGAARAIRQLDALASETGASRGGLQTLAEVFAGGGKYGASQDQGLAFTGTLSRIDAISGNRADQFGSISSSVAASLEDGRVNLAELNGMLEKSPALVGALERAFGKPIAEIKAMANEGRLFSEDFVRNLNSIEGEIEQTFDALGQTSERGWARASAAGSQFWESVVNSKAVSGLSDAIADAVTKGFERGAKDVENGQFWQRAILGGLAQSVSGPAGRVAVDAYFDTQNAVKDGERASGTPTGLPWRGEFSPSNNYLQDRGTHKHGGVDVAMGVGTPIYARADGTIVKTVQQGNNDPAGNRVRINFGDGSYDNYFHLQRFNMNLRSNEVKAGDIIGYSGNTGRSSGPHLHWEHFDASGNRVNPLEQSGYTSGQVAGGPSAAAQTMLQNGSAAQIRQLEADVQVLEAEVARDPNNQDAVTQLQVARERLRSAKASQSALSQTPVSRAQASLADRQRASAYGGGGATIAAQAYAQARAAREQGYDVTDDEFLSLGLSGAVVAADEQADVASRNADAAERVAASSNLYKMDREKAEIDNQVQDFRYQNFGSMTGEGVEEAVEKYRKALERLAEAQRTAANAQDLLNAATEEGLNTAEATALNGGSRGYALALARQEAEEEVIRRDGGSVEASRRRFNSQNELEDVRRRAANSDDIDAFNRYMAIGGDTYSRRQYERAEQIRTAGQGYNGEDAASELSGRFQREDARASKDRIDAGNATVQQEERRLEVAGLIGRARREALAVMERENELIAQGLLPAGASLSEEEEASVRANTERLHLISEQVEMMDRFATLAEDTAGAVGDTARSIFGDLFTDGRVKSEDLVKHVQSMVSRIGTTIAEGLIIKPLEKAVEGFAERGAEWLTDLIGAGGGGGEGGGKASSGAASAAAAAASSTKQVAAATTVAAAQVKAATASTVLTGTMASQTKATVLATGTLTTLAKMAASAAGALAAVAKTAALPGGGGGGGGGTPAPTPAAFGRVFPFAHGGIGSGTGGIGDSPTLFPFAGGAGLAFEAGPEAILPLKRGPDGRLGVAGAGGGGGGGTMLVINDMRGGDAPEIEQQETEGPNGQKIIETTIRSETKRAIREGAMDAPMRDTFGMSRRINRR